MSSQPQMLTLMVPTKNRSAFVIRMLDYYADTGYRHWIAIGDSSDEHHRQATRGAIERIGSKLKIYYAEYPNTDAGDCVRGLIASTHTKYAAFLPDDDFLVPDGLDSCMAFMEAHSDFVAAHGRAIILGCNEDGPYGSIAGSSVYEQVSIDGETASERFCQLMGRYGTSLFSVMCTDTWRRIFADVGLKDGTFNGELFPCCLSVIHGKVAELDGLYLVRQVHNARYLLPTVSEWMAAPGWPTAFELVKEYLSREIAAQDGISMEAAGTLIDEGFRTYAMRAAILENEHPRGLRRMTAMVRGLIAKSQPLHTFSRATWNGLRNLQHRMFFNDEVSLPALLNKRSSYHDAFVPVYRSITLKPNQDA